MRWSHKKRPPRPVVAGGPYHKLIASSTQIILRTQPELKFLEAARPQLYHFHGIGQTYCLDHSFVEPLFHRPVWVRTDLLECTDKCNFVFVSCWPLLVFVSPLERDSPSSEFLRDVYYAMKWREKVKFFYQLNK